MDEISKTPVLHMLLPHEYKRQSPSRSDGLCSCCYRIWWMSGSLKL